MGRHRVFKSECGEFFIDPIDDSDDFVASFDGKNWSEGLLFDPYAAQELLLISNQAEADAIIASATKGRTT